MTVLGDWPYAFHASLISPRLEVRLVAVRHAHLPCGLEVGKKMGIAEARSGTGFSLSKAKAAPVFPLELLFSACAPAISCRSELA